MGEDTFLAAALLIVSFVNELSSPATEQVGKFACCSSRRHLLGRVSQVLDYSNLYHQVNVLVPPHKSTIFYMLLHIIIASQMTMTARSSKVIAIHQTSRQMDRN